LYLQDETNLSWVTTSLLAASLLVISFGVALAGYIWCQYYKAFYGRKLRLFAFVPGKFYQPSLMFASKAKVYPIEAPLRCPLKGRLLALPTNIRLGWKMNVCDKHSSLLRKLVNYGQKSFITMGPGAFFIQRFSSLMVEQNKLECLFRQVFFKDSLILLGMAKEI
jgi:hypothetical protein